ncbi:MAG: nuclease-related domain-containing protein [Sporichthyaceae bacterium]
MAIFTGMGDLQVVRWRKYGKDRLYVNDQDGLRIGWVDLLTGQVTIEKSEQTDAFNAVVAAHHRPSVPSPRPSQEPAWVDLASNRPGQGVRELAEAELAAMKERSRVGTFFARTFDMKTDERAWRVGAGGEESVGGRLEKLAKHGWHVLHAVPVGDRGSDIDHVVIGPGGVFTLNTKTHPDGRVWVGRNSVRVNGHAVPYLRNSRFEAQRAERLLAAAVGFPVPVRPALVFLTGTLIPNVTIKAAPDDVVILDRTDIPGAFKRSSRHLVAEQVAEIYEHARRSTTWTRRVL